jgi:hypothetical protein
MAGDPIQNSLLRMSERPQQHLVVPDRQEAR